DRPFTESEHQFLERIREWGKKVVIVINKADLLETDADREAVRTFVRDNVHALLGFAPDLFAVSARAALQAKERSDAPALAASGFGELEGYVRTKLDDRERFRLKLLNPLGVGLRLCERYAAVIGERLEVLRADVATVEQIRTQIAGFRQEMTRGFQLRLADVDNLLHQFEKRGHDFFDETVRAGRIFDLLNRKRIQADFEEHVVRDLPRDIEARVERLIDWLVSSDLQQWQEVRDRLASRKSEQSERVAGRLAGGFEYDRGRLLDTVGKAAQQTLDAHDHRAEAKRLAESAQMAVANAALLEAGAVGLGTLVSLLATTTAADVTGIVAAGLLATVGFFVIPRRRQNAKKELGRRVSQLREQLMGGLSSQFARETERSVQRVEEAIAPYVQFVEGERLALAQRQEELAALDARLRGLRTNV
ncbi:MAG: dynamin, partial [Bryobacterales bacterium]|nr:dynamin [Bryobacterales bacterium]